MNKRSAVWAVLKIYKWRLLLIVLTVVVAVFTKNIIAADKPVGGAPNPDIDPL